MDSSLLELKVTLLAHGADIALPSYATSGSAGIDLQAAIGSAIIVRPGDRVLIPTGITMALPKGYEAQIRPRSGLAYKHGITVLNSPGTIDSDYRGEVKILLIHHGQEDFTIERGMRIAQMVITSYTQVKLISVKALEESKRGTGGFGSTGIIAPVTVGQTSSKERVKEPAS